MMTVLVSKYFVVFTKIPCSNPSQPHRERFTLYKKRLNTQWTFHENENDINKKDNVKNRRKNVFGFRVCCDIVWKGSNDERESSWQYVSLSVYIIPFISNLLYFETEVLFVFLFFLHIPKYNKKFNENCLITASFFSFIAMYIMFLNPHQCDIEIDHSWFIVCPYFCHTAFGKVVSQCGNIRMTTNLNT